MTDGDDGSKGLQHRKKGGAGQDGHFALSGGRGLSVSFFPFFRSSVLPPVPAKKTPCHMPRE